MDAAAHSMWKHGNDLVVDTACSCYARRWFFSSLLYCEFVDDDYSFTCNADGETMKVVARSAEELLEICDVVLRLLAASVGNSGVFFKWWCPGDVSINATSLAYLME
jgi:hypothetical protein